MQLYNISKFPFDKSDETHRWIGVHQINTVFDDGYILQQDDYSQYEDKYVQTALDLWALVRAKELSLDILWCSEFDENFEKFGFGLKKDTTFLTKNFISSAEELEYAIRLSLRDLIYCKAYSKGRYYFEVIEDFDMGIAIPAGINIDIASYATKGIFFRDWTNLIKESDLFGMLREWSQI